MSNDDEKNIRENSSFEDVDLSENSDSSSKSSTQTLKFPFTSSGESDSPSKSSDETSTSNGSHYIFKVEPEHIPTSLSIAEENPNGLASIFENKEEYSKMLKQKYSTNQNVEGIPNLINSVAVSAVLETDKNPNKNLTSSNVNENFDCPENLNKIIIIPRMTSSDSQIILNKNHSNVIDKELKLTKIKFEQNSDQQKKTDKEDIQEIVFIIEKMKTESVKSCIETERKPLSLFSNETYRSFTDSTTPEEDIIESMKSTNNINHIKSNKKESKTRVSFVKDVELKHSSLMSVPSTVCRICHTNTANERLLSPCYCKGSLAYVHLSCLERWLNQSSRSYCELCLYQYNAIETLRYGFFEGVRLWIRHPRNRNHVRSDCFIAFLLTVVTFGLLIICLIGMNYFIIEGIKLGFSRIWTKNFIVSFLGVITIGYIVTIYLIAKDQFVPWYTWWKNTLNIRLLLSPAVMQTQRI